VRLDALRAIKRALPYFEVSSDLLEAELKNRGFPPAFGATISGFSSRCCKAYIPALPRGSTHLRINQSLLPRAEVDEIRRLLEARHPPPAILLTAIRATARAPS